MSLASTVPYLEDVRRAFNQWYSSVPVFEFRQTDGYLVFCIRWYSMKLTDTSGISIWLNDMKHEEVDRDSRGRHRESQDGNILHAGAIKPMNPK